MSPWLLSLVIVLFFEGLMLGISPKKWQETMRQLTELPTETIRRIGLSMIVVAFVLLFVLYWGAR